MIDKKLIIDDSEIKKANKQRDDSFKKFCKETTDDLIIKVRVIRNNKGELTLWETIRKEDPNQKKKENNNL